MIFFFNNSRRRKPNPQKFLSQNFHDDLHDDDDDVFYAVRRCQAGAKKLLEVAAPIDQPVDNFMAWQVLRVRSEVRFQCLFIWGFPEQQKIPQFFFWKYQENLGQTYQHSWKKDVIFTTKGPFFFKPSWNPL